MSEPNRRSAGQLRRWADVPADQRREHTAPATAVGAARSHALGSHAECDHPRTKAARARCKRARAKAGEL